MNVSPQEHQLNAEERAEVKRRLQEPPKPELPAVRTFRVRRFGPDWMNDLHTDDMWEGIEAHRYDEHTNGNITFYRYLEAFPGEKGTIFSYKVEKLLAAGTYYDIVEVTQQFHPHTVN